MFTLPIKFRDYQLKKHLENETTRAKSYLSATSEAWKHIQVLQKVAWAMLQYPGDLGANQSWHTSCHESRNASISSAAAFNVCQSEGKCQAQSLPMLFSTVKVLEPVRLRFSGTVPCGAAAAILVFLIFLICTSGTPPPTSRRSKIFLSHSEAAVSSRRVLF